ncbi:MAG: hypothetical protein IJF33_06760, partial [Clostridia bacterium]|nr:hypothetical protein [Clostridia bacterium]
RKIKTDANENRKKVYTKEDVAKLAENFFVDNYTEEQYNNFGWVRANDILNEGQARDFYSKFADAVTGRARFPKTKSGEYMIAVSDIYDSDFEGVNNTIVYVKGKIECPQITRVLDIDEYDGTTLTEIRSEIYAIERRGLQRKAGGVCYVYVATDFRYSWNRSRNGSEDARHHDELGVRRSGSGETAGGIKALHFDDEGNEVSREVQYSLKGNSKQGRNVSEALKQSRAEVKELRGEIRHTDERNTLVNRALDRLQKLRDLKLGTYHNVAAFNDTRFRGSIERLAAIKYRGNLREAKTRELFQELLAWYTPQNTLFAERGGLYQQEIHDMMEAVAAGEGALSNDDLRCLIKVVSHLTHLVANYNKVYVGNRYVDAEPLVKAYLENAWHAKKIKLGWFSNFMESQYMQFFADPLSLVRYMDRYNEKGFYTETFRAFQRGAIEAGVIEMELLEPYEAFLKEHRGFQRHLTHDTVICQDFEIPVGLAVSLYMTTKREHAHRAFVYSGFAMKINGEIQRFVPVGEAGRQYTDEEIKALCKSVGDALYSQFSEVDKKYISVVEEIYGQCGILKGNTDVLRLGYTTVEPTLYYYPIFRANVAKNIDKESFFDEMDRVSNLSINKNLVEGAAGELLILPAGEVLTRHVHQVSLYHGLAIPTDNFNRLFHLNVGGNRNKPITLQSETSVTEFGRMMNEYLRKLKSDVEGVQSGTTDQRAFQKIVGMLRKAYAQFQLGLNPKTLLTQFSSFAAAGSILDVDAITQGMAMGGKDVDEWCALAKLRNRDNAAALAAGTLETLGKIGNVTMKPIGWVDRFVIERLFGACQVQIEKNGGAKVGTKQNKSEAGILLERVILETQQNSLATERSGAMRSSDELLKSLPMFSADSMKTFGRSLDARGEALVLQAELKRTDLSESERKALRERLKKVKKKGGRANAAHASGAVYAALLALAMRWLYGRLKDEDEDGKATLAEQGGDVLLDVIGGMIGGLPIIRDVYAFFTDGFEMENFLYSTVNNMLEATKASVELVTNAIQGKEITRQEIANTVRRALYAGGQVAGIPVRNVYNFSTGLVSKVSPSAGYHINALFTPQNYSADLNRAIEAGDDKMVATIAGLMMNEDIGSLSSDAREAIRPLVEAGYKVLPRAVGDTVTHGGEEITLTRAQKKRFEAVYSAADEAVEDLVKLSAFRGATQEEQAKALRFVWDTYFALAMDDLLGEDSEKKAVLFAEAIPIEKLAMVVATVGSITADTDQSGRPLSGSRKAKITAYISSLRMTAVEKYMLMGWLGYVNLHGEAQVKAHINTLNLSQNEKALLLKYSGYAA